MRTLCSVQLQGSPNPRGTSSRKRTLPSVSHRENSHQTSSRPFKKVLVPSSSECPRPSSEIHSATPVFGVASLLRRRKCQTISQNAVHRTGQGSASKSMSSGIKSGNVAEAAAVPALRARDGRSPKHDHGQHRMERLFDLRAGFRASPRARSRS
jgi:hypothetical protein